jgi:hypothetical protein
MAKSRKPSSISREFDGKEVQGKLFERSGLFGSKVSKEVFKMPGGGKHIEKTRTNKKGDVVSTLSRNTKVNPLKVFNDNKEKAIKKAGGEMSKYKKSLKRFQGDRDGSQVEPSESSEPSSENFGNDYSKPISANLNVGNFSGGFQGNVGSNKISNSQFSAGYNNPKSGFGVSGAYRPESKEFSAGLNYNTTIGKHKIPVKVGLNYNKKGGSIKRK